MYDAGAVVCSRVNAYVQAYRCKSIGRVGEGGSIRFAKGGDMECESYLGVIAVVLITCVRRVGIT